MRFTIGNTILAFGLLLASNAVWALGLGDARVVSFIGQPLEMRIDLLTAPNDNLDSVTARLATAEDFALIGASRGAISVPLLFSVREGEDGNAYILVTSRQSLSDPVLRLVVEVNWASGRLLREYTVFLDPPTVPARAPQPVAAAPEPAPPVAAETPPPAASESAPVESAPAPQPSPSTAESRSEPQPQPESQPEPGQHLTAGDRYGPVQSGDTLWSIASDYASQASLDMNRVMLAIQRRNPDAFVNDNINLLKRGEVLEMPSVEEVNELALSRARELVAQQEAAFRMRSSLASASTPLLAAESAVEAAEAAVTDGDQEAEGSIVSRLEIVPASDEDLAAVESGTGAVPGGEGSEQVSGDLREALARTEEELISERQQNEYLRERIDELEAQLAEAEGEAASGIVPDEELASLEERLQAERMESAEAEQESAQADTIPSVTTSTADSDQQSWYSRPMTWVIMIVILVAAVAGWMFNRRRGEEFVLEEAAEAHDTVAGLKGEAEEILRALDADVAQAAEEPQDGVTFVNDPDPVEDDFKAAADESGDVGDDDHPDDDVDKDLSADEDQPKEAGTGAHEEPGSPVIPLSRARRQREESGDATFLDESSSDPEIKLDLARAYISMGDKEAARVILQEVVEMGNEAQQSEARSMLNAL